MSDNSEEKEVVYKNCTNCEKKHAVKEDEVTCPLCGTVTLQDKE